MPCVGLVVLAGCLTFVVAPDEELGLDRKLAKALPPSLPTVVVDPGHGGKDDGATALGMVEKDITLDVSFRVEKLLQSFGFPTVLTRRDNRFISLEERANIANRIEPSIFVSIHFDKSHHAPANGVATFYGKSKVAPERSWTWIGFFNSTPEPEADHGEELAGYVQAALLARTGSNNRGIHGRDLYVLRHVRGPAVLVEGGFLSNAFDARLLTTNEYRDRVAAAVVEGIITFQSKQPHRQEPAQLAAAAR